MTDIASQKLTQPQKNMLLKASRTTELYVGRGQQWRTAKLLRSIGLVEGSLTFISITPLGRKFLEPSHV